MKINIIQNSYGKSAVRLAKVTRHADSHDFKEIHVNILLEGDFVTAYTEGSNAKVLPTDTMKNTIFALAKDHPLTTIEDFGLHLTDYFLSNNAQVSAVTIDLTQIRWERMVNGAFAEPYAYISGSNELQITKIRRGRTEGVSIESGIKGMRILKTTKSSFQGYIVDKFTTLSPASDRILATEMEAVWQYGRSENIDFQEVRNKIRQDLCTTFAEHHSDSLQQSLYLMGEIILKNVDIVDKISFKMPNLHYLPVNLLPFDMENNNDIFVASGDAFGYITGTLIREND